MPRNIEKTNPLRGDNGQFYTRTIQSLAELRQRISEVLDLMNEHTLETLPLGADGVGQVVKLVLKGHDLLCSMARCYDQEISRQMEAAAEIESPEIADISRDAEFEKFMRELLGGDYPVQ